MSNSEEQQPVSDRQVSDPLGVHIRVDDTTIVRRAELIERIYASVVASEHVLREDVRNIHADVRAAADASFQRDAQIGNEAHKAAVAATAAATLAIFAAVASGVALYVSHRNGAYLKENMPSKEELQRQALERELMELRRRLTTP